MSDQQYTATGQSFHVTSNLLGSVTEQHEGAYSITLAVLDQRNTKTGRAFFMSRPAVSGKLRDNVKVHTSAALTVSDQQNARTGHLKKNHVTKSRINHYMIGARKIMKAYRTLSQP